jgi:environmental stress-induced protein Ves
LWGGCSRLAAVTIECTVGISSDPTVVRFADCEPESWANGAGVTRVIARGWISQSSNDFDWRLSVADVTASGPFSALPGVDRVITLADGPGLLLQVDDEEFALDPYRPLWFAGEARTQCQVIEPTRDFNVMTRRDVCSATVDVRVGSGILAAPLDDISYVVALKGQASVTISDDDLVMLEQFDAVMLTAAAELRMVGDGRVAVIRIRPRFIALKQSAEYVR